MSKVRNKLKLIALSYKLGGLRMHKKHPSLRCKRGYKNIHLTLPLVCRPPIF